MPLLAPLAEKRADLIRVPRHGAVRVHRETETDERLERLGLRRRGAFPLPAGDGVEDRRRASGAPSPANRGGAATRPPRSAGSRRGGRPPLPARRSARGTRTCRGRPRRATSRRRGAPGGSRSGRTRIVLTFGVTSSPVVPSPRVAASHEHTVLVDEGDREAVDLQLADDLGEPPVEPVAHARQPRVELRLVVRVLEREERHLVADVREVVDRGAADPPRRASRG